MNYLIYDCEIIKCIPTGAIFDEYEYCSGWDDFENMGISVVGVCLKVEELGVFEYKLLTLDPVLGRQAEIDSNKLRTFAQDFKQIIGFNSKSFDDNLCRANEIQIQTTYDVLEEVRIAAFGSPRWQDTPKGYRYSLDAIARANGMAKTGSGAMAPQLWQEKRYQEVCDYCLNDVRITKEVLELGLKGKLVDPNTGKLLKIRGLE